MSQQLETPRAFDVVLPQFINLVQDDKYVYAVTSPDGLAFGRASPDSSCIFEVIPDATSSDKFTLKTRSGQDVGISGFYPGQVGLGVNGISATLLRFIQVSETDIYLRTDGYFFSDVLNRDPLSFVSTEASTGGGPAPRLSLAPSALANTRYTIREPILRRELLDISYDVSNAQILELPPVIALSTSVRNDSSAADVVQTLEYSYSKSETGTWNNVVGIELGAKMSFEAGVPFIASAKWEVSVSVAYQHEWGGSVGTVRTVTSSTAVTVPAKTKGKVLVLVRQGQLDVNFTYKEKTWYMTGEERVVEKKGIYRNVDSYHVDVEASDWEEV